MSDKAQGAFLTISELADSLGLPQHILRYWETRFPQLRPLQRAGKRRYYRPDDVALARKIDRLLNQEGYTIKGVQKLLNERSGSVAVAAAPSPTPAPIVPSTTGDHIAALKRLRAQLADALAAA